MGDKDLMDQEEIYSKVLRAGRRTYFFDVRSTKTMGRSITKNIKFTCTRRTSNPLRKLWKK